jgi:dTDP-4-amino-4,6-dideoxygalactose transaminase
MIEPYRPDWSVVTEFEKQIAKFFGAPYAVATDSCTHAIELCLRYVNAPYITCPKRTYLSIPMLANKLGIDLIWNDYEWKGYYQVCGNIFDAAVLWRANSYVPKTFMCVSFQFQKHLSLGRAGVILCDSEKAATDLKRMSYDGRIPGIPWREQNIETMGYHYPITPETAALGLQKLPEAIATPPRIWQTSDWPDISQMKVFNK